MNRVYTTRASIKTLPGVRGVRTTTELQLNILSTLKSCFKTTPLRGMFTQINDHRYNHHGILPTYIKDICRHTFHSLRV